MEQLVTEISNTGEFTTTIRTNKPAKMKIKPSIKISFSNGVPMKYIESKGFKTNVEGSYDACLALLDEMRKAIVMFKEDEVKL
jgi:hypothetical protein